MLNDHDHTLVVLIRECLNNRPACRPDARNIIKRVERLRKEHKDDLMAMEKLQLIKELQKVQSDLGELQVSRAT